LDFQTLGGAAPFSGEMISLDSGKPLGRSPGAARISLAPHNIDVVLAPR
jgi:hypothetical protein